MNKKIKLLFVITTILHLCTLCVTCANDHYINDYIMFRIQKIADSKSRFLIDGMTRKDRNKRIKDNINWYKKYGSVNVYYNVYGLDIENFRNQDDFLSSSEIKESNNNILNKFEFYQKLSNINKNVLPKLYIACDHNQVLYPNKNVQPKTILDQIPNGKYIFKSILSNFGNGIYIINKKNNSIDIEGPNKTLELNNFLIQSYIDQHEDLSRFNASSLNSIKIISVKHNNKIDILSAILKISTNEKSITNSIHQGGTCIGITSDGKLLEYGTYLKNKSIEKEHPISHIKYKNYQIPYWNKILNMIKDLHNKLPEFDYISWNIGISKKGPVIIGINDSCNITIMQMANGGLRNRFNDLT